MCGEVLLLLSHVCHEILRFLQNETRHKFAEIEFQFQTIRDGWIWNRLQWIMKPNVPEAIHGLRREVNLWTDHTIFRKVFVSVFDFGWPLRCICAGTFPNLCIDLINPDTDNFTKFSDANWLLSLYFVVVCFPHVHRVLQVFGRPSHIRMRCRCSSTYSPTRVLSSFWKFFELNEVFDIVNYHNRICLGGCWTLGIASFMRTCLSTHMCLCYRLSIESINRINLAKSSARVFWNWIHSRIINRLRFVERHSRLSSSDDETFVVFLAATRWCEWSSHFAAIKFIIIRSDRTFSFSRLAICVTQTRRDS